MCSSLNDHRATTIVIALDRFSALSRIAESRKRVSRPNAALAKRNACRAYNIYLDNNLDTCK